MVDIGRRERRKGMSLVLLLVAAFWATPTCLAQQVTVTPYPPGVYGMWPILVPNTTVTNDISTDVKCSVINGIETCKCNEITCTQATTCTPATTHPPYTGQLLLDNRPEPLGTGGVVGILLTVPWTSVYTGSEPSQQDWTAMDELLIEAQACGLNVALALSMPLDNVPPFAGPPGLPQWVADQITCSPPSCPNGMMIQETVILGTPPSPLTGLPANSASNICPPQTSSFTTPCLIPVFWDPTFNKDQVGFIQAAATHIATMYPRPSPGQQNPVAQNIAAVLVQPFGATDDDWNIPHSMSDGGVDQVTAWLTAAENSTSNPACNMSGNSTSVFACYMFGAAQTILNAAATAFPSQNLKLPIQAEGTALDGTNPTTGTDVALATDVLSWAYGTSSGFSERFFAQLNFVRANTNPSAPNCATPTTPCPASPPDCVSPCSLDMPQSPYSVFNLLRQYQRQGVGLQDVGAAVDGGAPNNDCQQNGTTPCTPPTCNDSTDPVQYAVVSQNTWDVVQTYTPRFWEISRGDATTAFGTANPCYPSYPIGLPSDQQAAMRTVFADATTQLETLPTCAQNFDSEFYMTRSGYGFNFGTQRFYQTVKMTNTGLKPIGGPIELVLDNLSNNASLPNQSGVTACAVPLGSPLANLSGPLAPPLAPGASASVTLQFADPSKAAITYTPRVLAGTGAQ
jgi:hypothetical protein